MPARVTQLCGGGVERGCESLRGRGPGEARGREKRPGAQITVWISEESDFSYASIKVQIWIIKPVNSRKNWQFTLETRSKQIAKGSLSMLL
jgi:hypothetical protein